MNQDQIDALNVVQPVIRLLAVSLATAARMDMQELSLLLQSAAANESLPPMSRAMLTDLGTGLGSLGHGGKERAH